MNTKTLDGINVGLIAISLALAYVMPFGLFIAAYAILGPLHYLTELNWLHGKGYFSPNRSWVYVSVTAAILVTLPKILTFIGATQFKSANAIGQYLSEISNGVIFLGVWSAAAFMVFKKPIWQMLSIVLGVVLSYFLKDASAYALIIGTLIPTVLHVYLFTALFMLYGAMKGGSRLGLLTVFLLALVPVIIILIPIDHTIYSFSDFTKNTFLDNRFFAVNVEIGKLLGLTDGKNFYFYGPWELKVQTFIAFAYLYHYLNWFSKTSVIGWHHGLKGKKALAIIAIWLCQVALFAIDYRLGFMSALTFSFWHVFAEFPLNVLSIKGIGEYLKQSLLE